MSEPSAMDTNPTNSAITASSASGTPSNAPEPIIASSAVVQPDSGTTQNRKQEVGTEPSITGKIISKINSSNNILIALSSDPSVDELAAAIGLSLSLDRLGKRITAIYSGLTPNALKFLKPEETFASSPDILRDFVIAINKEKADHLRYKVDGEYVKIFITPYRSQITKGDLEFSYGDFNIDLVIALDVSNGVDLDDALREHGRIMHDAMVINLTTGKPGKLGEIEWSDGNASSISEMATELLFQMGGVEKEEATALLTGIVAATSRFANARTTSKTMEIASRLMASGANQQLVSKNITADLENKGFGLTPAAIRAAAKVDNDSTKLNIAHEDEPSTDEKSEPQTDAAGQETTLLEELKAAEASLLDAAAEVTPEEKEQPIDIGSEQPESIPLSPEVGNNINRSEMVVEPTPSFSNPATSAVPTVASAPEVNGIPEIDYLPLPGDEILSPPPTPPVNFGSAPDLTVETPSSTVITSPELPPLNGQPVMQDQVYRPQAANPGAFQIPGL